MGNTKVRTNPNDISSFANFDKIRQESIHIDAFIDFKSQTIKGKVNIVFKVLDENENIVILDNKALKIFNVYMKSNNKRLKWKICKDSKNKNALGTPIVIELDEKFKVDSTFELSIEFSTTQHSDAAQWLRPDQTLSQKYPFMFTQCEAILARTLIPCQDTPSAKVTVKATLTIEKPLIALFSGIEVARYDHKENPEHHSFEYVQKIPVPTYLIALAAGELEYGRLSERCGVWTEVGLREKAVYEFENTEELLKTAENYLTPYEWGVYNILVLPFAFPYGGMENPCLTFVTPALIAGDRSMINVIAHEIAHSWTGNLVTNKDWTNFWMNEGFTTFMERKICELMNGEDMSNLEASVGKVELREAIESTGPSHSFSSLDPDLMNRDPDDAFSVVPYEKGYTFLYYLETLVGKENFQKILQSYITKFAYKSVSHLEFRQHFEEQVKLLLGEDNQVLQEIDWDAWIKTPGVPIKTFEFKSTWIEKANELAEGFLSGNVDDLSAKETFIEWHTNVKLVFLGYLEENLTRITPDIYTKLTNTLELHSGYNAEIKYLWYKIALRLKQTDVIPSVKEFLSSHGRMKYIRPVYTAWHQFQPKESVEFFKENRKLYHQVAARCIEKNLNLKSK